MLTDQLETSMPELHVKVRSDSVLLNHFNVSDFKLPRIVLLPRMVITKFGLNYLCQIQLMVTKHYFHWCTINLLSPGTVILNVILKLYLQNHVLKTSCEIFPRSVPENPYDNTWTLAHIMAWWHQAKCHFLNQCWPSSMMPYGVSRP